MVRGVERRCVRVRSGSDAQLLFSDQCLCGEHVQVRILSTAVLHDVLGRLAELRAYAIFEHDRSVPEPGRQLVRDSLPDGQESEECARRFHALVEVDSSEESLGEIGVRFDGSASAVDQLRFIGQDELAEFETERDPSDELIGLEPIRTVRDREEFDVRTLLSRVLEHQKVEDAVAEEFEPLVRIPHRMLPCSYGRRVRERL